MGKVRRDILLLLLFSCIVSMMLSAAVAVILSADSMTQELQKAQLDVISLIRHTKESGENLDMVSEWIARFGNYRVEQQKDAVDFSDRERARLAREGYVQKGWQANVRTYFYLDDEMYVAYAERENIFTVRDTLQGYLNVACTVLVLFVVFYYMFGRRLIAPVAEMTKAAQRVGEGNFDTKIQTRLFRKSGIFQQINLLVDSFNQMSDDLKSIAYLRNDFVRNLSHEVKTPIATISGYAYLMETTPLPEEETKEYAHLIRQECAHLTKLSENMLRITRIEGRKQTPKSAQFALDEQLRRVCAAMFPQFQKAGLSLEVDLQSIRIRSDQELIQQVWINLLENALKFTPEGGQVAVRARMREDCAHVSVSDTGIGMAKNVEKHIFDKFYQADTSRRTEGNGLGLALCRQIVEVVNGSIDVNSEEGKGSTFTVSLPLDIDNKSTSVRAPKYEKTGNGQSVQEDMGGA